MIWHMLGDMLIVYRLERQVLWLRKNRGKMSTQQFWRTLLMRCVLAMIWAAELEVLCFGLGWRLPWWSSFVTSAVGIVLADKTDDFDDWASGVGKKLTQKFARRRPARAAM